MNANDEAARELARTRISSRLTSIDFISQSVIPRRPELNVTSIERFSSSCCAEGEAIKYSENSDKPAVDFEPNRGEIISGIFLP